MTETESHTIAAQLGTIFVHCYCKWAAVAFALLMIMSAYL